MTLFSKKNHSCPCKEEVSLLYTFRALEAETENPLNVHRWRKLEGSDPSTFELIQKIQALQKRMVACKKKLENTELELKEKEKACINHSV